MKSNVRSEFKGLGFSAVVYPANGHPVMWVAKCESLNIMSQGGTRNDAIEQLYAIAAVKFTAHARRQVLGGLTPSERVAGKQGRITLPLRRIIEATAELKDIDSIKLPTAP